MDLNARWLQRVTTRSCGICRANRSCGHPRVRKRHFLRHLYIKCIILPRQARDKHRENSKKCRFPSEYSTYSDSNGGRCLAKLVNRNYVDGNFTALIVWDMVWACKSSSQGAILYKYSNSSTIRVRVECHKTNRQTAPDRPIAHSVEWWCWWWW